MMPAVLEAATTRLGYTEAWLVLGVVHANTTCALTTASRTLPTWSNTAIVRF